MNPALKPMLPSILLRQQDRAIADNLEQCLAATLAALRAIPQPFDQAFLGADEAPGRRAILTAITALEAQAEAIARPSMMPARSMIDGLARRNGRFISASSAIDER